MELDTATYIDTQLKEHFADVVWHFVSDTEMHREGTEVLCKKPNKLIEIFGKKF
jgi:hypothetical protein